MRRATKKILVIEDNMMLAETYVELLSGSGYEVLEVACTGKEALSMARDDRPDLMIVDIGLKGTMDGIETASRISGDNGMPVIFISGMSDEKSRKRMSAIANHRFLMKPVDFRVLEKTINELLKH